MSEACVLLALFCVAVAASIFVWKRRRGVIMIGEKPADVLPNLADTLGAAMGLKFKESVPFTGQDAKDYLDALRKRYDDSVEEFRTLGFGEALLDEHPLSVRLRNDTIASLSSLAAKSLADYARSYMAQCDDNAARTVEFARFVTSTVYRIAMTESLPEVGAALEDGTRELAVRLRDEIESRREAALGDLQKYTAHGLSDELMAIVDLRNKYDKCLKEATTAGQADGE